jgi:hypothetical protein
LSGRRPGTAAPFVRAAGSAVLGIVVVLSGLSSFVSASAFTAWWQSVLAVSALGVLITGFERPIKQLGTFVRGWTFVELIVLALIVLKLHSSNVAAETDEITALLVVATVIDAICATFAFAGFVRGRPDASGIVLPILASLLTAGSLILALGNAKMSVGIFRGGEGVIFAAAFATLIGSVVESLGDRVVPSRRI